MASPHEPRSPAQVNVSAGRRAEARRARGARHDPRRRGRPAGDVTVHGGPHRAVSILGIEAIRRVAAEGHPIAPGTTGENLTTEGFDVSALPVGTRLSIGAEVVLELSQARPVPAPSATRSATCASGGSRRRRTRPTAACTRGSCARASSGPATRSASRHRRATPPSSRSPIAWTARRAEGHSRWAAAVDAGRRVGCWTTARSPHRRRALLQAPPSIGLGFTPAERFGRCAKPSSELKAGPGSVADADAAISPSSSTSTRQPPSTAAAQNASALARSASSSRSAIRLLGALAGRCLEPDRVAGANGALAQHPGVHAAVARVCLHREPPESQVGERVADRAARVRRLRDLEHHLVADGQPRPHRQRGHVEPLGRQVLAGRARRDRVALGGDPPDRLDPQDRHGTMRPAVHRVARLPVALDPVGRDRAPPRPAASAPRRPRR